MKKFAVLAMALALAACSQESTETEAVVTDETPAVEEAPATAPATTEGSEAEAVQVVEESAAEEPEASDDKPLLLAQAEDPAEARDWQFAEGTHYARLVPSQPTWGGADKIEVVEFFWYGCPHCYDFEPYVNRWNAQKDPGVRLVKVPAMWNTMLEKHARLYFVAEIFARSGEIKNPERFHEVVFEEFHRRGNRLVADDAIYELFSRVGISREDFDKNWKSFEVDQNLRKARDLARRYNVNSVPSVVVNGKYRTAASEAGSYPKLIELIDELTVREGLR